MKTIGQIDKPISERLDDYILERIKKHPNAPIMTRELVRDWLSRQPENNTSVAQLDRAANPDNKDEDIHLAQEVPGVDGSTPSASTNKIQEAIEAERCARHLEWELMRALREPIMDFFRKQKPPSYENKQQLFTLDQLEAACREAVENAVNTVVATTNNRGGCIIKALFREEWFQQYKAMLAGEK